MSTYKSHIITEANIVVIFDDKVQSYPKSHPFFLKAKDYISHKRFHKLDYEGNMEKSSFRSGCQGLKIAKGKVTVDGENLPKVLQKKLLEMYQQGAPCGPMVKFWRNLLLNPSKDAQKELFDFLLHSHIPLTEDGCFIAYKRVRKDMKDIYSGKMDNSVGEFVVMPRPEVDDNRERTCSKGLHAAAWGYLDSYAPQAGNVTVEVKINPRDVVSIPVDYQFMKLRVSQYKVIKKVRESNKKAVVRA